MLNTFQLNAVKKMENVLGFSITLRRVAVTTHNYEFWLIGKIDFINWKTEGP